MIVTIFLFHFKIISDKTKRVRILEMIKLILILFRLRLLQIEIQR